MTRTQTLAAYLTQITSALFAKPPKVEIKGEDIAVDGGIIIKTTGMAEGDMATLVLRTADNLRQIAALKDTYPEVAGCAYKAREAILREPVLFL